MGSDPRLYNERLFVVGGLENWNWKYRVTEPREWEYNGVRELSQFEIATGS
jgi:hypothetical protein